LINWYARFEGRKKRVEDIASPELRAMMEPLQAFLAAQLAPIGDGRSGSALDVIFCWDQAGSLSFSLSGDQVDIAEAIALIGERAEFRVLDS
jgi:hypothetical protein